MDYYPERQSPSPIRSEYPLKRLSPATAIASLALFFLFAGAAQASPLATSKARQLVQRAERRHYGNVQVGACWRVSHRLVRCHASGDTTVANVLFNGHPLSGAWSFIATVIQHRHCWIVVDSLFLRPVKVPRAGGPRSTRRNQT